jgi:hypothetical protein
LPKIAAVEPEGSSKVSRSMTTNNALAFLLLGVGMFFVPLEWPQLFPANAGDGSCTSALWLGVMGTLQALLGAGQVMQNEILRLRQAIEAWDPLGRPFDQPEAQWAMPASFFAAASYETAA